MERTDVINALEGVENLPTLPVVAQQILKLVNNKMSNMTQIAAVIARDQAISARVVRLVNSAFYGLRTHVSSIQHAIVILGLNTVKNLVIGVSVIKTFQDSNRASIFDREQFWIHAFATALASRYIAQQLRLEEPEDYFLAGLLHDIGILVEDQFLHDEFVRILERCVSENADLTVIEQEVCGMCHGDIGAFLGAKWNVPAFIIHVMRFHHNPDSIAPEAQASNMRIAIAHVADTKTRAACIGNFAENVGDRCSNSALKTIGLSESKIDEIVEKAKNETNDLLKEWGM